MDTLNEYSYIWGPDIDKYVLVKDELGDSIFSINGKELMFLLIEDDIVADAVIAKMLECGNKVYNSIAELQEAVGFKSAK